MQAVRILTLALVCAAAVHARAADTSVEDVITLAQKNLGEDVLLATIEGANRPFNLKADEIVRLKEAKVSDRVIAAMIRHRQGAAAPAAPAAPAPEAPAAPAAPAPAAPSKAELPVAGQPAFGVLNIENLDERVWSYRFEPDTQTIWISTSASDGRGNIAAHGGLAIRLPAGAYNIRYNGQDRGQKVAVFENDKSLMMISRVETAEIEALYVSVFERGERKASGRLVTLRENAAPREDNVIRKSSTWSGGVDRDRVVERIVEVPQQQVIVRESPTIIYSEPSVIYAGGGYYGGGYYGGGYYGGGYYGSSYYGRGYGSYIGLSFGNRNFGGSVYYGGGYNRGYGYGSYYGGGYGGGYRGGSYYGGGSHYNGNRGGGSYYNGNRGGGGGFGGGRTGYGYSSGGGRGSSRF